MKMSSTKHLFPYFIHQPPEMTTGSFSEWDCKNYTWRRLIRLFPTLPLKITHPGCQPAVCIILDNILHRQLTVMTLIQNGKLMSFGYLRSNWNQATAAAFSPCENRAWLGRWRYGRIRFVRNPGSRFDISLIIRYNNITTVTNNIILFWRQSGIFDMKEFITYVYFVCIIFCRYDENKNVLDKRRVILCLWEGFNKLVRYGTGRKPATHRIKN